MPPVQPGPCTNHTGPQGKVSAEPWEDQGHYLGVIILCMFTNCKLSQIECIEFRNIKSADGGYHPDPSDPHQIDVCPPPVTAMHPAARFPYLPHGPHPSPLLFRGHPSPLWGSAHMAIPGGPVLVASSSVRPRGWGHGVHPKQPTMQPCVVGCCSSPGSEALCSLPRSPRSSWVLIPLAPQPHPTT